jgi:hypothetical protein
MIDNIATGLIYTIFAINVLWAMGRAYKRRKGRKP